MLTSKQGKQACERLMGEMIGSWVSGPKDEIMMRPCPPSGGDIVCLPPYRYEASMKKWETNKRLIKAAPTLLQALLDLKGMEHHITDQALRAKFVDRVYSAIEKAIGK